MGAPSANEQMLLELINDARLNPMGNAARYITSYSPLTSNDASIQNALNFFGVNGTMLQTAFAALVPVQPLAWNNLLADAATGHNNLMISFDSQSHQLPGEPDLGVRATNAGYTGWSSLGENVFAYATSPINAHAGFMVDWGFGPGGMQDPPGHRDSIMSSSFREIGISAIAENNGATSVGPLVVTQNFGNRFAAPQVMILGVAYNDSNANQFYTPGEGLGTLSVNAGVPSTTSAASGGYTLGSNAGALTLTFSGAGLSGAVTVTGTFANGTNAKIDVVNGNTMLTSHSISVSGPITNLNGLGLTGLSLATGAGTQALNGTPGNDTLNGGTGADAMAGGLGNDTYHIDDFGDQISELAGQGTDSVLAVVDYIMHANIENATLTGAGNSVLGNDLPNTITGNGNGNGIAGGLGNDTINGGAGDDAIDGQGGADSMVGGTGIDTYFVDQAGDIVVETEAGVFDTIWTMVTMTLPANVEILILNGALALNGTGNDGPADNTPNLMLGNNAVNVLTTFGGDDIILGRDGNDTINSGPGSAAGVEIISGGIGADTLTSGGGHDFFAYESIAEAGDTITDFTTAGGNNLDILDLRPMFFPTFTGTAGITTVAQAVASGHLTFAQSGANTQVFADANGGANNNVLLATLLNTTAAAVQSVTLI
jgi:Ca2+-binding RTX toxin-like protein